MPHARHQRERESREYICEINESISQYMCCVVNFNNSIFIFIIICRNYKDNLYSLLNIRKLFIFRFFTIFCAAQTATLFSPKADEVRHEIIAAVVMANLNSHYFTVQKT